MQSELLSILFIFLSAIAVAYPLGYYISGVYSDRPGPADRIFTPFENLLYRLSRIDARRPMDWKAQLRAMLLLNFIWFAWAMWVLCNQGWLPWNPDHNPSMSPDLAFHTAVSFVVNCNQQHYSGETGATYFSQVFALMFLQFASAATGMAAAVTVFNAMRGGADPGNFYRFLVRSATRILLPISLAAALLLAALGVPMNLSGGRETQPALQGDSMSVSRGPVAAFAAIKQLGTNGGGWYGANSAHPLENPGVGSDVLENILMLLLPMAFVFALGFYLNQKRLALVIFGVMTLGFLLLLIPAFQAETHFGTPEGKEVRFGAGLSALWSISTTATSNGSVNAMHDSFSPMSNTLQLLGMMVNALYGGVGVGFLNFYVFLILAAFTGGLMVGRTPEFLGKKVEAREMKIAMLIALLHPLLILGGTAVASFLLAAGARGSDTWLHNPGFHGYSEMLYEFASAAANNGSGMEGLADNNPFWNIATGIVLLLGRFLPIIGPVAIAGLLAAKKAIPESSGTLRPDSLSFGLLVFALLFIFTALAFFPALSLGSLAEFFSF